MIRWDPSATEWLPEYMKGVYMVLYETVNELGREAKKSQGRDTINYVRRAIWTIRTLTYICEKKNIFIDKIHLVG